MNRLMLKIIGDMQEVHADVRSIALQGLAAEVLDGLANGSRIQPATGFGDYRLIASSFDHGTVDHDGRLEVIEDIGSSDPYNSI